jgi:hypothetical protein
MARRGTAVLLLLGAVALGCGGKDAEELPTLHPVTGKVLKHGQPVAGGSIRFTPVNEQAEIIMKGRVGEDGTFELITWKGKTRESKTSAAGAPVGTYYVTYSPPTLSKTALPVTSKETYKVEAKANEFTFEVGGDKPF